MSITTGTHPVHETTRERLVLFGKWAITFLQARVNNVSFAAHLTFYFLVYGKFLALEFRSLGAYPF